ncbi:ZIP family metal transporter [Legionella sainthelensi]|uniref:ZIP family metal transporter n=1 Tax=Legionella sainthelensi TaxID=28087 RepID=UPI000E209382|nr:ZIP family metal transporter [Legionella sainthelensi]
MTPSLTFIILYSLMPAALMLIGGGVASIYQPGNQITSATQHFAAGVVFAAVAKELLPKIGAYHDFVALIVGFSLGIIGMLYLKWLTSRLEDLEQQTKGISWGLLTAVGIDLLVDGLLIGVSFLAGEKGGVLIALALSIEIFFLGLSTTSTLGVRQVNVPIRLLATFILAILIPIGAGLGAGLLIHLPQTVTNVILSFGVAALLYLVIEELLIEAHKVRETPSITLCFFVGFLLILLLESLAS